MAAKQTPPDAYICPITSEMMSDPVSTSDGFTYEREAILEWLRSGNTTSPLSGVVLERNDLVPNHALRAAIQQFVEANPEFQSEVYQTKPTQAREPEVVPNRSASAEPELTTVMGMPMDAPVAPSTPPKLVGEGKLVAEGGASASAGSVVVLTEEDAAAAAPFAVADWSQLRRKPQAASKKPLFFGGGGRKPAPPEGLDPQALPDELAVRATVSGYGGAALQVEVASEGGLLHLARMLAAKPTAPVSLLELTSKEAMQGADELWCTEGFALLTRALAAAPCLRELRELSISRVSLPGPAATALGLALRGHRALRALELWNVELDDGGGLAVVRAVLGSCPQLGKLNLGRHLIGPQTAKTLEELCDSSDVRLSLF